MAEAKLQSALVLQKVAALPWGHAIKPGTELTTPNPLGGIKSLAEDGTPIRDGGVDIQGYADRDRELQWRDASLAKAIEVIARRAATIYGASVSFVATPGAPVTDTGHTGTYTIAAGQTTLTATLANIPVKRGSISAVVADASTSATVTDDGLSGILANGIVTGGTIDYVTGELTLTVYASATLARSIALSYSSTEYLHKSTSDIDDSQLTEALGGATGVRYVKNSSYPVYAQTTDKDLYRRDLVLYEVLTYADQIFVQLKTAWASATALPTIPTTMVGQNDISGVPPSNYWSWAEALPNFKLPLFGERWGTAVFGDADKYLAWRDNVLARYAAELSKQLTSVSTSRSELQAIATEDGQDIIVEDANTQTDLPLPSGAFYPTNVINFYVCDAEQNGLVVKTYLGGADLGGAAKQLQIGDVITWAGGSDSATIFEITDDRYVKAFPSQTIAKAATNISRDLAIKMPPRALLVEPYIWAKVQDGYAAQFGFANRLLLRVTDSQVASYLATDVDQAGLPKLDFNEVPLEWSPESISRGVNVLRYRDTEYQALGDRALARVPRQEAELYLLTSETSRYRTFKAQPPLPNSCRQLVYDKWLNLVRWYPHLLQDVVEYKPAAPTVGGIRQSQELELLGANQVGLDSEYWRQKAAQVQCTPCHERVVDYRGYEAVTGTPFGYQHATPTPTPVTTQPAIFTQVGKVQYTHFTLAGVSLEPRAQWYQVNLLVEPLTTWPRHGNTWSPTDSTGIISANQYGLTLPPAASTNSYQLATNIPTAAWQLTLPAGEYSVVFNWEDLNSVVAPLHATVRWNGQIISTAEWHATAPNVSTQSIAALFTATVATGVLSVTVDSPVRPSGILIEYFTLQKLSPLPSVATYTPRLQFYDTNVESAGLTPLPIQCFKAGLSAGSAEVISTDWIPIEKISTRTELNCELRLPVVPTIPLAIKAIELRTRLKIEPISDWQGYSSYKATCLSSAITGLKAKYTRLYWPTEFRLGAAGSYTWTSATTALWHTNILTVEPRLRQAFRAGLPGDIGRPALVPYGVYGVGSTVVSTTETLAEAWPNLVPWQPWMAQLGFLVAMEDFWVVAEPALPARLTIIDPSGEDQGVYDEFAPNMDFTGVEGSQQVPII